MKKEINNIKISYDVSGDGKPIILLHGWGANRNTFNRVYSHLILNFKVYNIDLPGFGETEEPREPLSILDLAMLLNDFIKSENIESPIIMAHSYGGRIAIRYASMFKVKKLILIDSAGIKPKMSLKTKLKIKVYKLLNFFHIKNNMGSMDYKAASLMKRKMLVKAVNDDLTNILSDIKCETLLIWGEHDKVTPLREARIMEDKIPNCGLVIIEDATHFPYLEKYSYFILVIDSFLSSEINV